LKEGYPGAQRRSFSETISLWKKRLRTDEGKKGVEEREPNSFSLSFISTKRKKVFAYRGRPGFRTIKVVQGKVISKDRRGKVCYRVK